MPVHEWPKRCWYTNRQCCLSGIDYSNTWLRRPPRIVTTCFQRPLLRARTVSYRKCTANSDHLPCVTSDRVFRAWSACFPCVERPCDDPNPPFFVNFPNKHLTASQEVLMQKTHFSYFTFWTLLMIFVIFFLSGHLALSLKVSHCLTCE